MKIVNIIILISVFIYGVIEMRKASSLIKSDLFSQLSYDDKIKTTRKIKDNWKVSIILLSLIVCEMLILLSSFLGKVHYYDKYIDIFIVVVSIAICILLNINSRKFNNNIKK